MKKKVTLVYRDLEDNIAEETVWTEPLDDGYYRIDNIPFYAPNVSNKDIISVENDEGVLYFDDLIKASGHSTVQVIFFDDSKAKEFLKIIEKLGCKWEGMKGQPYYTIDVPYDVDYQDVKNTLDEASDKEILDYRESCLAENHG